MARHLLQKTVDSCSISCPAFVCGLIGGRRRDALHGRLRLSLFSASLIPLQKAMKQRKQPMLHSQFPPKWLRGRHWFGLRIEHAGHYISHIDTRLGGILSAKRRYSRKFQSENDYGVASFTDGCLATNYIEMHALCRRRTRIILFLI
jgi:hypothetical protein